MPIHFARIKMSANEASSYSVNWNCFFIVNTNQTWNLKPSGLQSFALREVSSPFVKILLSFFLSPLLLPSVSVIVVNSVFNLSVYFHFILLRFINRQKQLSFYSTSMGRSGVSREQWRIKERMKVILITFYISNSLWNKNTEW